MEQWEARMIRGFVTTVAVVGVALAAGGAFYDQSRRADATVAVDSAPAAPKGDRLAVAPLDRPALQPVIAATGSEGRILRAHAKVFAANARSRFMTVALPGGERTTVLARVPSAE
jgi:hypothetical protein